MQNAPLSPFPKAHGMAACRVQLQRALQQDAADFDTSDVEPLELPGASAQDTKHNAPPSVPSVVTPSTLLEPKLTKPSHIDMPPPPFAPVSALTVSAVLSRSGQVHPISTHMRRSEDDLRLLRRHMPKQNTIEEEERDDDMEPTHADALMSMMPSLLRDFWSQEPSSRNKKDYRAGRYHTGSALEAIGALFLRQDSAGRLDQLSLNESRHRVSSWRWRLPLWIRHMEIGPLILLLETIRRRVGSWIISDELPPSPERPRSFHGTDDLPETPLLMPGGFIPEDSDVLMLPPPLLDNHGRDAWSFEGLLGVRRMREQLERQQRVDKMLKYHRPAHRVDAFTAFMNFVRSAKASESRHYTRHALVGPSQVQRRTPYGLWKQPPVLSQAKAHVMDDQMLPSPKPTKRSSLEFLDLATSSRKRLKPKSVLTEQVALKPSSQDKAQEATTLGVMWIVLSYVFVSVAFVPDFVVFFLAHSLDLFMDAFEFLSYIFWFVRWVWRNVTGQTILGRIIIEAYVLFKREWEHVIREDHEESADRMQRFLGIPLFCRPRGLSTFQVLRGFIELACVQAVTREQYQREGAGLICLGVRQEVASNSDVDNDDLVVTSQGNDILELSRTLGAETQPCERTLWEEEDKAALVHNIKWASQLAISAYGLRVLIVDLPPVFTPSGKQLPRQTFAHLSRLKTDDVLHADIQTLDMEATYMPTFYVVRDMRRKVVCVAVRGTQSFADIVVDLDMKTEDITASLAEWRGIPIDEGTERYAYHAGIWRAAKSLVAPGSTLFNKLQETLTEHEDFGLVFVGHSLGGAIASAAAILLSEYHMDAPDIDPRKGMWRTTSQGGFPGGRPIRAITFAHPSTLSHTLNRRTSYGVVPLVISVILGSDIIPRFGHGQLRELRRVLGALTRVRRRRGLVPTTISSHLDHMSEDQELSVHIVRRFWDWLSICRTRHPDAVMLDKKKRLEALFWRLRCEVENDLYAQAKRRFDDAASSQTLASTEPISPWVQAQRRNAPLHALSARRQRLDYATLKSEFAQGGVLVPAGRVLWLSDEELYEITNPMAFFSLPDLHPSMFADHFPAAYEEAILALS